MQFWRRSLRVAKFLGKILLGLILILFSAIAIIHLPPVQKQITRAVSNYLSTKIEAKVYIERINFSILGHVIIQDLTVWNPAGIKIVSIHKIELTSSIVDLLTGDFIFDDIQIIGLDGALTQDKDGLNIQFILNAFQPTETKTTTKSKAVKLQFNNVQLENSNFGFVSTSNGIAVTNVVGMLIIQDVELSTQPTTIKADNVSLHQAAVDILLTTRPEVSESTSGIINNSTYTNSRITINVKGLNVEDSDFSLHQNEIRNTPKFDTDHLSLQKINISLSDILVGVRKDTVAAILHSLSTQSPGFNVDDVRAKLQWSNDRAVVSDFHFKSNTNELNGNFAGGLNNDNMSMDVSARGHLIPQDFSYFLSDSAMKYLSHWQSTELNLDGYCNIEKGEIKTLNVKTKNSQLQASGKVGHVLDLEKLYWNDLAVNTTIGSDFKLSLAPFLQNVNTPSDTKIELKSSGNIKSALVDGKVFTPWGDVTLNGMAGRQAYNVETDLSLTGEQVDIGKWLDVSSIGPINFSLHTKGMFGRDNNAMVDGSINSFEILDQSINDIKLQSRIKESNATVNLQLEDPKYKSEIQSDISFSGPLIFTSNAQFDDFNVGGLLYDSTLFISGDVKSILTFDQSSMEGSIESDSIVLRNQFRKYILDTLCVHALLSPTKSEFDLYSDDGEGKLTSNFDIRNSTDLIQTRIIQILKKHNNNIPSAGNRRLNFTAKSKNARLFQLLGIQVDDFSSINIAGDLDEQKQTTILKATAEKFKGYGISLDTLNANLLAFPDTVSASVKAENLFYQKVELGDLNFNLISEGDTALTNLSLSSDSSTIFSFDARILPSDSGTFIYPETLHALHHDYVLDPKNKITIKDNGIVLNDFQVSHEDMKIMMNGDANAFEVSFQNVDLTPLNLFLSTDSTVIDQGIINGHISYALHKKELNLKAKIDSLSLYHSDLFTLDATAESDGDQAPFEFLLTNTSNKINLKGQYNLENTEIDAALLLDVTNAEIFTFLVSGIVNEMSGTIKGETKITGSIKKPAFNGHVQFQDVEFTTANPKLTFKIQGDRLALNNSTLQFNQFTLYDQQQHPLTVDGIVSTKDYQSIDYDLQVNADQYTLMNRADSTSSQLSGVLVIDSDIKLKGNEKDTNVEAKIAIKDATRLTYINATEGIELLQADGIVDFIDPSVFQDSVTLNLSSTYYDSLIASLPDFNLNSTVTVENDASIRIIIDEYSGDFMEASGGAALELGYDRSGNLRLAGNYTIKKGVYRLSFYNLVKKNFTLVPESSINWSGSPENGDLNIKAIHTVASNSLGLIGDEIGDNEKSTYKRSLDYQVGININGTIEKPIISFSLDLPKEEKTNYPVLANKLDRLRQPEFESELNKQVFGLLVLGGFLPETSGSDVNSNTIAATALSNSVNSLLAGQLNRFASQHIKGVNIDVGIQSYSDYSSPGGKTQTAMDFRVSKQIMDDRLSFEVGGDFDINSDQSGANTGNKNYRGDIAIIYNLTTNGDKQLKLFNNETYDIIYQEIRNTGVSIIFVREFSGKEKKEKKE